ncbi:neuroepithelial cell-transforming gene 1 protein-like [Archocentrus centrarchus]|uniref:neuroepithelial cell-transforming gene 1 protein-like n=1 Tax=Archocentrus centrarchus TaxID=63155 RepID=UPI0011E9D939|nr:neuroepithelial cell-transforming gene 1 protein-like [Archocentrus centrarchus]
MGETREFKAPVVLSKEPKRQPNLKRKFSADEEEFPLENSRILTRSLQRGRSFTFLTPKPQWDFSLKRKHREKDGSDAVSLCSIDFKV